MAVEQPDSTRRRRELAQELLKISYKLLNRDAIDAGATRPLLHVIEKKPLPCVNRRVDVTEVPFIGGDLAVRMEVSPAQHELELLFGEV
jgi:hypothetical protein